MRQWFSGPPLRLRVVERPALSAANVVMEIEDSTGALLATVSRHQPEDGQRDAGYNVDDRSGARLLTLLRPQVADRAERGLWAIADGAGHRIAEAAVRCRLIGDRITLRVSRPGGQPVVEVQARRLATSWTLRAATGGSVAMDVLPAAVRPGSARRLDLAAIDEGHRREALAAAVISLLVGYVPANPSRTSPARRPRFGNASDWASLLDF